MKRILVFAFMLISVFVHAQALLNGVGHSGELFIRNAKENDLPDSERIRINKRIAANVASLKEQGILKGQKQELQSAEGTHILFNWPLVYSGIDSNFYIIGNYVDQNPALDTILDYACGQTTYDGHAGTDIFGWPYPWLNMDSEIVTIVAAADGILIDSHDGEYDRDCVMDNQPANYVILQHSDGSTSYYWHMKSGTVTTLPIGSAVTTGTYLGHVGSSGSSTGPHLHFEVHTGVDMSTPLIDPSDTTGGCNYLNTDSWWIKQFPYRKTAVTRVSTHKILPVFPDCPLDETPNEQYCFNPGDSIYFIVFGINSNNNAPSITVKQPDGSVWITSTGGNSTYQEWYWYWYYYLPSNPQTGKWTVEGTIAGTSYIDTFYVNGLPTVSIAASPSAATCSGAITTFTAAPVNGGTVPNYQWTKNGSNVGTNSYIYIDSALVAGDQIESELISGSSCPFYSTVISNQITMTSGTPPVAPTITHSDDWDTLFASPSSYSAYKWYKTASPAVTASTSDTLVIGTDTSWYTVVVSNARGCTASAAASQSRILPVELISFTASLDGGSVDILWSTASEINDNFFTVERSDNGIDFVSIGNVSGAGNSTHVIDYSYIDHEPLQGVSYYRLTQTDYDGKQTRSSVIVIDIDNTARNSVYLQPNPVADQLLVTVNAFPNENTTISIYNAFGQKVYNKNVKLNSGINQFNIDVSGLSRSVYFLTVENENTVSSEIMIKE